MAKTRWNKYEELINRIDEIVKKMKTETGSLSESLLQVEADG